MFDYGESDIVHLLLRAFFSYILLTFNLNSNDPLVSPSDILHFHSIYSHSFQFKIISARAGQSHIYVRKRQNMKFIGSLFVTYDSSLAVIDIILN